MIDLPLLQYDLPTRLKESSPQVFDPVRKKWVALTPEEHVRQRLIRHLTAALQYPLPLMAVEKALPIGGRKQRFDLVVYERQRHVPWLLAECKAPEVPLSEAVLLQLLRYHSRLQCRYWLLTNGHLHFCADAAVPEEIRWLERLPPYDL